MNEPTCPREQAIARYGSHWVCSRGGEPVVREILGGVRQGIDPSDGTLEKALAAARVCRCENRANDARSAAHKLAANRLTILMAKLGLHSRSQAIRKEVESLKSAIALAAVDDTSWQPKIEPLPDRLRLPVPIDIGTCLWEVGWEWPMRYGLRLRKLEVSAVGVYESGREDKWDWYVQYYTTRIDKDSGTPGREPVFTYYRDDFSNPQVDLDSNCDSAVFLTRAAALDRLRQAADDLEKQVAQARSTLSEMATAKV